jgi:hypothetical protein
LGRGSHFQNATEGLGTLLEGTQAGFPVGDGCDPDSVVGNPQEGGVRFDFEVDAHMTGTAVADNVVQGLFEEEDEVAPSFEVEFEVIGAMEAPTDTAQHYIRDFPEPLGQWFAHAFRNQGEVDDFPQRE